MKNKISFKVKNRIYEIKRMNSTNIQEMQKLCFKCLDYFIMDQGSRAGKDDVHKILEALPPGKTCQDKYNLGIYRDHDLLGYVDLIKDYPESGGWMLGLILIDPSERKKGLGKEAHKEIVDFVKSKNGNSIKIGVLEDNKKAIEFWNKLGYKLINEREMDRGSNDVKKVLIFTYSF